MPSENKDHYGNVDTQNTDTTAEKNRGVAVSADVKEAVSDTLSSEIFEYYDADGNLLCKAEATYTGENVAVEKDKFKATGKVLKSFIIINAAGQRFDLLELANSHNTKIVIAHERTVHSWSDREKNLLFVSPLETPLDIAKMLHELGHVEQAHDEAFAKLLPLYGQEWSFDDLQAITPENFSRILDAVPDLESSKIIREIRKIIDRYKQVQAEILQADDAKHVELENELDLLKAQMEALELKDVHLAGIPTKIMERDATLRAFLWLRQLRKMTGVNLFKTIRVPLTNSMADQFSEEFRNGVLCDKSIHSEAAENPDGTIKINALKEMRFALELYYADTNSKRIRGTDGDAGVIPMAGMTPEKRKKLEKKDSTSL